jgi:tetratricopeptide (TPR) repeat protein
MRVTWITTLLAAWTMGDAVAQSVIKYVPVSVACLELNQTVMTQMAVGKLTEAELAVSAVLTSGADHTQDSCAGLVLSNMAAFMAVSGRIADAERLAGRSVLILEKTCPPNDVVLLPPLRILAAARFEQGKTARARQALKRMQSIRIQRPEDSALVHGTAATLLKAEGRRLEAEAEYLAAFRAWGEAGRGETADAGAILSSLGSLYIEEQRLAEARRALDQALIIFGRAKDTVPMDRIKLLNVRGVLHARQGDWREAEQELHDALSMSDREPWVNPVALRSLLTNYAQVLRRNHHGREARSIEARAAALQPDRTTAAIVDITDLLPKAKPAKK